ncbi:MAG TPA: metallophosphoesterase family protein [Terricaulis sp.]|nr:metallophosphoesterase family protein [Terricaulis sp.]
MDLLAMLMPKPPPPAACPDGRVRYAVGDIHGRADLLEEMLKRLEARAIEDLRPAGEPVVIFLGDYVDRGRESSRVLDLLIEARPAGFERRYLKGNHEQSMLAFLEDPITHRAWLMHGGNETLLSYGVQPPSPLHSKDEDWAAAAAALSEKLPPAHLKFLKDLERYIAVGDYVFAHAGIDPARPLTKQTDRDLFWIRARFLNSRRRGKYRVVHGHTPVDSPYSDRRRVGVDTGAYASGVLTAARLEGPELDFLAVSERDIRQAKAAGGAGVQF